MSAMILCGVVWALTTMWHAVDGVEILNLEWSTLASSAGKRRFFHNGVVVPLGGSTTNFGYWTFGGLRDNENVLCDVDVLLLDSMKWENWHTGCVTPADGRNSGPSSPRYAYSVVYAPQSRKILIHGGSNINPFSHRVGVLAHTFQYTITDSKTTTGWNELYPLEMTAYHPPPRSEHTAVVYTTSANKEIMIVYGGRGNNRGWVRGDVLHYDLAANVWTKSTSFRNVSGHAAVVYERKMYVVGGWDGQGYFYSDVAVYDIEQASWSILVTAGAQPDGRRHGAFVPVVPHEDDPKSQYALFIGGYKLLTDINAAVDAMHSALIAAGKSTNITMDIVREFVPEDEDGELQDELEKEYVSEVWKFEFETHTWTRILDESPSAARLYWPTAFSYRDDEDVHVFVYGGAERDERSQAVGDLHRLTLSHCPLGFAGENCTTAIDCSALADCSENGLCVGVKKCRCRAGYGLPDCSQFNCQLLRNCSRNGRCVGANVCECDSAHQGVDCALPFIVTPKPPPPPPPAPTKKAPLSVSGDGDDALSEATLAGRIAAIVAGVVFLLAIVIVYFISRKVKRRVQQPVVRYEKDAYN